MNVVWVKWKDSCTQGSAWTSTKDARRFAKCADHICTTSGFRLHEDKEYITLVQSVGPHGRTHDHLIRIPKACIVTRYDLDAPKAKGKALVVDSKRTKIPIRRGKK